MPLSDNSGTAVWFTVRVVRIKRWMSACGPSETSRHVRDTRLKTGSKRTLERSVLSITGFCEVAPSNFVNPLLSEKEEAG
jgi:hypothetical protein